MCRPTGVCEENGGRQFLANFNKFRETLDIDCNRHFSMKFNPQGSGGVGTGPKSPFSPPLFSQTMTGRRIRVFFVFSKNWQFKCWLRQQETFQKTCLMKLAEFNQFEVGVKNSFLVFFCCFGFFQTIGQNGRSGRREARRSSSFDESSDYLVVE